MEYREKIQKIRHSFLIGDIELDKAKELVAPLLEEMNTKAKRIAKENGFKFKKLTFNYVFR